MKLGIPMFFGLPNPNLKLVFQNSKKGAPLGEGRGESQNFLKNLNSPILMKLDIPMFFGLPNPILKLVSQNSTKRLPSGGGGEGGFLKIFKKLKI